eukprot:CAMPEP_0178395950 /NCGR_PEP_ID=MMETSP0689_2-20121128/13480_1 /TAXON_ID=160604 /ORGANISM="Amphidinium massartii, Strain CS-259" /LENGTH=42 /DNA_ID= /DNA_START= /DNA_END= /DNA_ORIENTATION=
MKLEPELNKDLMRMLRTSSGFGTLSSLAKWHSCLHFSGGDLS